MILRWILLLLVLANKLALASSFLSDDLDENEFLWSLDRKLFPIDNQNESMCSPLQGRLSLFYRLTHILDPSFPLGRSPSEAKSTLWAGGFQRTGDEVLGHSLGCPSLPIRRDHNYTYYTVGGGLIRRAERTLIPRLNQYSFFNHTGIRFISALACGVSNCDTVGVSLYPVIIPFSMAPYLYIAGIAFSKNGNLVSNSSAIKVWDGSGLAKFTPRGHFWFSVLWYILPPLPTPLRYAFGITLVFSIFGGRGMLFRFESSLSECKLIFIFQIRMQQPPLLL